MNTKNIRIIPIPQANGSTWKILCNWTYNQQVDEMNRIQIPVVLYTNNMETQMKSNL